MWDKLTRRQVLGVAKRPKPVQRVRGGMREVWDDTVPPGGWVCAEPAGDLGRRCGQPTESEPCPIHHPGES